MIAIKKVGTESIPAIQELAAISWNHAYAAILPAEQMSYMLQLFYSTTALEAQMQKGHQFILLEDNDEPIGFASYSIKDITDNLTGIFRLHKIYIDPGHQGKGVGKKLLHFMMDDIRPAGATAIELNVNRSNKALGFYQHLGFEIIAAEDINIGNGYFMNDYIMNLLLKDHTK